MYEQLDLFGGENHKPQEIPKKKYAIAPPEQIVVESAPEEGASTSKTEVNKDDLAYQEFVPEINSSIDQLTDSAVPEQSANTSSVISEVIQQDPEFSIQSSQPTASIDIPEDDTLYSKQYYAISEVASMFKVNISLLRFWEKEFDILKPRKNKKGDRLFRPDDIKNLKLIYFLLREKKYTIEGARTFIKKGKKVNEHFEAIETLKNLRKMLTELKESLS